MINALALALEAAAATAAVSVVVRRGSTVGSGDERETFQNPVIELAYSVSEREYSGDLWKTEDVAPASKAMFWRRDRVELPVNLWIQSPTKTERAPLLEVIKSVFFPIVDGMPADAILSPEAGVNHDYKLRVMPGRITNRDEQSAQDGYATAVWTAALVTSEIQRVEMITKTQQITVIEE